MWSVHVVLSCQAKMHIAHASLGGRQFFRQEEDANIFFVSGFLLCGCDLMSSFLALFSAVDGYIFHMGHCDQDSAML